MVKIFVCGRVLKVESRKFYLSCVLCAWYLICSRALTHNKLVSKSHRVGAAQIKPQRLEESNLSGLCLIDVFDWSVLLCRRLKKTENWLLLHRNSRTGVRSEKWLVSEKTMSMGDLWWATWRSDLQSTCGIAEIRRPDRWAISVCTRSPEKKNKES